MVLLNSYGLPVVFKYSFSLAIQYFVHLSHHHAISLISGQGKIWKTVAWHGGYGWKTWKQSTKTTYGGNHCHQTQ